MDHGMEGLFTAASGPTTNRCIDVVALKEGLPTVNADATNAYWHFDETDDVCCAVPPEMIEQRRPQTLDTDVVFKLKKKLYGRRDASEGFADFARDQMRARGFEQCIGQPSFHQDDFHVTGAWSRSSSPVRDERRADAEVVRATGLETWASQAPPRQDA